jgi:hypothetical protein
MSAGALTLVLMDLLTRPAETGETRHNAEDATSRGRWDLDQQ